MRNRTRCGGVYSHMKRVLLVLIASMAAAAQESPDDPMRAAILLAANGSFTQQQAPATREQAREFLRHWPAGSEDFVELTQQVAQLYLNGGWNAEGRAVLEEALARTGPLGKAHPARVALLNQLATSWEEDGNLLKSAGYLQQVAAGLEPEGGAAAMQADINLAELYRRLGRTESLEGLEAKIRVLGATDPSALAAYYERSGELAEAVDIYRKMADDATEPAAKSDAWQNLARIAASQEHFADASSAIQQAIAAQQSVTERDGPDPVLQMRMTLAGYLQSAGSTDQADQIYRQLFQESRPVEHEPQFLYNYSTFLARTNRLAQGENILKDYLVSHPDLDPPDKNFALQGLAAIAGMAGDSQAAERYAQAAGAL